MFISFRVKYEIITENVSKNMFAKTVTLNTYFMYILKKYYVYKTYVEIYELRPSMSIHDLFIYLLLYVL